MVDYSVSFGHSGDILQNRTHDPGFTNSCLFWIYEFFYNSGIYFNMMLALVFEQLRISLVSEQRLRGQKHKLVNALRSRCSVTRKFFAV
jgi:hypothetical protein